MTLEFINTTYGNPFDFDFGSATYSMGVSPDGTASNIHFSLDIGGGIVRHFSVFSDRIITYQNGEFTGARITGIRVNDNYFSGDAYLGNIDLVFISNNGGLPMNLLALDAEQLLSTLENYLETGELGITGEIRLLAGNPFEPVGNVPTDQGNDFIEFTAGSYARMTLSFNPSDPVLMENGMFVSGTITAIEMKYPIRAPGGQTLYDTYVSISAPGGIPAEFMNSDPATILRTLQFAIANGADFSGSLANAGSVNADIIHAGHGDDLVKAMGGNDIVYGGTGDDRVYSGSGDDQLFGGAGDDQLYGQTGNDLVVGEDGNDRLYGQGGDDTLRGDAGDDYLDGGAGSDYLWGGTGNDLLRGGTGSDFLYAEGGNDRLYGESGDDTLNGMSGNNYLDGGAGNDTIYGGTGNDIIRGGTGADHAAGGAGNDTIRGDDGNDRLLGDSGNDYLFGGAGNDNLDGGVGDDRLYGNDGDDYLWGYIGNDILIGGYGNDSLGGGMGNDRLYGGAGNDLLIGYEDNDYLDGGAGNDFLDAGSGTDTIVTGAGNDLIRFAEGYGANHVTDFENGMDTIDISWLAGASDGLAWDQIVGYGATQDGTGTVIWYGEDFIILNNFNVADLDASDFYLG